MKAEPKILDYSPPEARSGRRWLAIVIGVCVILAFPVRDFTASWPDRFRNLFAQRRCLRFVQSPGTVVYEEDPSAATKLAGGRLSGEGWSTLSTTGRPGATVLGYSATAPQCFRQIAFPGLGLIADPSSFFARWGFAGVENFVFMGGRSAATGPERLVCLSLSPTFALRQGNSKALSPGVSQERSVINWFVIQPASWSSAKMTILQSGAWGDHNFWINMPWPLRMYAGQADPNDSSRFAIPYRTPNGAFTVDVQLQADDRLTFSIREASHADGPMP